MIKLELNKYVVQNMKVCEAMREMGFTDKEIQKYVDRQNEKDRAESVENCGAKMVDPQESEAQK